MEETTSVSPQSLVLISFFGVFSGSSPASVRQPKVEEATGVFTSTTIGWDHCINYTVNFILSIYGTNYVISLP